MNKQGNSTKVVAVVIVVLVIIGGGYLVLRGRDVNQSSTLSPSPQSSPVQSSEGNATFTFYSEENKRIVKDFIPFVLTESLLEKIPEQLKVRLISKNDSETKHEFSFSNTTWHAPAFYVPIKLMSGIYTFEVTTLESEGYGFVETEKLYQDELVIERNVLDSNLITVEQTYPITKDSWEGVSPQQFAPDKELKFLEFEIRNNTNSVMRIRAFEMGTEAGGRANFIKTFSIYDPSNGRKLSSISDLFQTSKTMVDYNLHYLDTPLEIAPQESRRVELRGSVLREFLPPTLSSSPAFFFYQLFGETENGVVRKEVYMSPRAKI